MPAVTPNLEPDAPEWTSNGKFLYAFFLQVTCDLGKRIDDHLAAMERWHVSERTSTNVAIKSLEDQLQAQIVSTAEGLSNALTANEKSAVKAENATAAQFLSVGEKFTVANEFRASLSDLSNRFALRDEVAQVRTTASELANKSITRSEVDAKMDSLNEKIAGLASRVDKRDGSGTGATNLWIIFVAAASILIGLGGIAAVIFEALHK